MRIIAPETHPFVESGKGTTPFKNVIYDYPLGKAMADGFVKEPAAITRENFNPKGMSTEAIEQMKLEDGVDLHEKIKVELETYARETDNDIVKPFVLVIARDTTHAAQLLQLIQSDKFFAGRYKDKVIQVDSSTKEDEIVARLLKVEHADEPTEIVIHVNMLKEGWDVTNLYTIVPLRAANARTLIEQSIGRGLRLPYGKRTGVKAVDRLNIIAHDKFQEIIDEANKPDSAIRLQQIVLSSAEIGKKTVTVVSQSNLASKLGIQPTQISANTQVAGKDETPVFKETEDQKVAQLTYEVIRKLEYQPKKLQSVKQLNSPEVQSLIKEQVDVLYRPAQLDLEGVTPKPDIAKIIAKTTALVIQQTIDIPRILILPKGTVKSGFKPFKLDLKTLNYPAPSDTLWVQHLRTQEREIIGLGTGGIEEKRMENYVVSGLVDFDDIAYDQHNELLYDLATQTVEHFRKYLDEDQTKKVLRLHQRELARFIHAQMQDHHYEDGEGEYDVNIKGFTDLKPSAYNASATDTILDFKHSPADKSNMAKYLFGGFQKCLYPVQKFQSDSERKLAVILERDSLKWFKPAKGQFCIFYKFTGEEREYLPDFVVETESYTYMLEPKARNELDDAEVKAKAEVAVRWCKMATDYAPEHGWKPWKYALIPHDVIAENMTLQGLVERFGN